VRSGRNLHPEAGHITINYEDQTALCGCGSYGCAEAYLSGKYFSQRTSLKLRKPGITGSEIAQLARSGNQTALQAFDEYSTQMAVTLQTYTRLYTPEVVVLTGSFADASDLFLSSTRKKLRELLKKQKGGLQWMPKLRLSSLNNRAGLLGGAYIALNP
jgi:predicted NBD/HSP70 family sugar kinase